MPRDPEAPKAPQRKRSSTAKPGSSKEVSSKDAAPKEKAASKKPAASAGSKPAEPLELPADVAASLVKGVGAYIRQSPQLDLPTRLRRFRGFTDKSLMRHSRELLEVLEDEAQRTLIAQWLGDGKPAISKDVAGALGLAAGREEGWEEKLRALSRGDEASPDRGPSKAAKALEQAVEREKAKTAKAREELRHTREGSAAELKQARAEQRAVEQKVVSLEKELAEVRALLERAEQATTRSEERADREVRRARKDADDAQSQLARVKEEARALRKENEELRSELAAAVAKNQKKPAPRKKPPAEPTGPRKALPVPKGRFEDAPETLEEWLGAPRVHLIVDGYNVSKAEGGYGELPLEVQRERVIDEVGKLAARRKIAATIVFDGSEEVGPRPARPARTPVKVEYSKAEIADDHIVALLEKLPAFPVIVVTNDRELQERAGVHGATVATSDQLLSLLH